MNFYAILQACAQLTLGIPPPPGWNSQPQIREKLATLENDVFPVVIIAPAGGVADDYQDNEQTFENQIVMQYGVSVGCAFEGNLLVGLDLSSLLTWRQAMRQALWNLVTESDVDDLIFQRRTVRMGATIDPASSKKGVRWSAMTGNYWVDESRT